MKKNIKNDFTFYFLSTFPVCLIMPEIPYQIAFTSESFSKIF